MNKLDQLFRTMDTLQWRVENHKGWKLWMRHWVFVEDSLITGYAPDNSIITSNKDVDTFFRDYEEGGIEWVRVN